MSGAVREFVLTQVSPSQIKTFRLCGKSWFYEKVLGLPKPERDFQATGTAIHAEFENHYLEGTEPEHPSVLAALALPQLRKVRLPVIEEPRNYELGLLAAGIKVRGRIDMLVPPDEDGRVWVNDWKSCSSWRYLKTPEQLARDEQGIIYGRYAFAQHPDATSYLFSHVYVRTKGGSGARFVGCDPLTRDDVDEMWTGIEATVGEMKEAAALIDAADVPHNLDACGAYGGCPYRSQCPAGSASIASMLGFSEEKETGMTLAEKLRKNREHGKVAINPPDAAPSAPPPAKVEVVEAPVAVEVPFVVEAPVTPVLSAMSVVETVEERAAIMEFDGGLSREEADRAAALETEPPAPAPKAKAKAPKVKAPPPATSSSTVPAEVVYTSPTTSLTLYVDCEPVKGGGDVLRLEDEIRAREASLIEHLRRHLPGDVPADCVDLRQIRFGAGTAALAASFKVKPVAGVVVATSHGLSGAVLDVLAAQATVVVRAVR